ncbi:MAG TPA: phage holin family protein [Gemmataceae bacterium]|jgi:hypothetical protein
MRNDVPNGVSPPSLSSLVSDILTDVQQLVAQQARLVRLEIREDLRKARTGAIFLGAGLGVTLVGGLLFCLMLPYLLNWVTGEQIPLWACFGIFGVVFLFLGGGAVYAAQRKFRSAAALPESRASLKENVACLLRRN